MERLVQEKAWFLEKNKKRKVLLRGINLGGDCKVPYPDGGTQYKTNFLNHREVSFIGRPFPLEEAEEHFTRIRNWGFNCLRLLTTWEAVEHSGPGIYDEAYLDYLTKICSLAKDYGLYVFIDFHQDVWSRMTGGDGAPGWTLELVGMDISKIAPSDSAIVMQYHYDYSKPGTRQEKNYPTMCWSQNYRYPANGIMWTLFFAGRDFAKNFHINGQNIQDFLQSHYLNSMKQVAMRVKDMDHVLGFDSLNEPSRGWIGWKLNGRCAEENLNQINQPGPAWAPIEGLYAALGNSVEIPYAKLSWLKRKFILKDKKLMNPNRICLWKNPDLGDPFLLEGAWELKDGMPFIVNNDYFLYANGRKVNFETDYMIPFIHRVYENIHSVREDWMVFAEKEAMETFQKPEFSLPLPPNSVNASHWYDVTTLVLKRFFYPVTINPINGIPVIGRNGIQKMYESQMQKIQKASEQLNCPTLLGEFGIPFDFNGGKAYKKWKKGNHSPKIWKYHILALDLMYNAIDNLQLHSTLWNYTAGNRNNFMIGDQWNQEDLSIYSMDQRLNRELSICHLYGGGGRAIEGFSRPYPKYIAGSYPKFQFHSSSKIFSLEYIVEKNDIHKETVVFIPDIHYQGGIEVKVIQGDIQIKRDAIHLYIISLNTGIVEIKIQPQK